jgi:ribonuclease HI
MVLRREDGRCIGAATKVLKGKDDADLAEAMGLKAGLDLASHLGISKLVVEMDADNIVQAIVKKRYPRTQWGGIVRQCARVFEEKNQISIRWIGRNSNAAAHALARWAIQEPNTYWADNFPFCLHPHIQKDMEFVTDLSIY